MATSDSLSQSDYKTRLETTWLQKTAWTKMAPKKAAKMITKDNVSQHKIQTKARANITTKDSLNQNDYNARLETKWPQKTVWTKMAVKKGLSQTDYETRLQTKWLQETAWTNMAAKKKAAKVITKDNVSQNKHKPRL